MISPLDSRLQDTVTQLPPVAILAAVDRLG